MIGPILNGEKVILKPIKVEEAEKFLKWLQDKQVTKYILNDGTGLTLKKERDHILKMRKSKEKMVWSIFTKEGMHIGSTGLHKIDKKRNKKADWGITIGEKSYWNKGYGTDTLKTVLKFCFSEFKLNRVELSVFPGNIGGIRLYLKCGFKKEGIKRKSIFKRGKYLDEIIMGILNNEFKKL